jgi:hypothetical protein
MQMSLGRGNVDANYLQRVRAVAKKCTFYARLLWSLDMRLSCKRKKFLMLDEGVYVQG